ncbi:MAG: hypothetical protein KGK30_07980, partial [Elusimicrobia bacterium]|nr:hypothetical protein [Elusimicrobiota bacterium]
AIYAPPDSRWRIKPGASFKYEMLQQTADEALGNGLYDYMMYSAGVDFEYVVQEPFGLRFGLDYSGVHFPNYTSLESQAATQFQGQSLARELVGDHVLDTQNVLLTVSADGPLPDRLILEGTGSFLYQRYPNQHVVAPSGDLSQPLREDLITSLAGSLKAPRRLDDGLRLLGALDAAVSYDSSNQNSFDATQIHYLPYYYNFGELRVGPSVKIMAGPEDKAVVLSMGFTYWYRRYPYRPTQDPSSGVYNPGSPTHTHDWMFSSSLSYPMAPHFGMLLAFQFGRAESNQTFQQFYRYDYDTANYLIGFSYDL